MNCQRIEAPALREYARAIMRAHGVDEDRARSVSENLIWSEIVGRSNYEMVRLPIHLKRVASGVLTCPCHPRFEKLADSIELLDGDNGFGHHVGRLGMDRAIELARATGIGIVGVRNSNFFGTGAYYVHKAAEAGMIGLAMSNSYPKVAAHGGIKAVLGTNPFAFGAPRRNGEPLMLDMATSAIAGSMIREHIANGAPIPAGMAVDNNGVPILDPEKVGEGALLPFAGPKGYGMALLVEILAGVITGAGMSHGVSSMYKNFSEGGHNGHFMMALDISRWMPLETYYQRFEGLIETIKSSNDSQPVQLPGENRWRSRRDALANGIHVPPELRKSLMDMAEPHGIEPPWQFDQPVVAKALGL